MTTAVDCAENSAQRVHLQENASPAILIAIHVVIASHVASFHASHVMDVAEISPETAPRLWRVPVNVVICIYVRLADKEEG